MLVKYYQYHHPDPALELLASRINEMMYKRYASELLYSLLRSPGFSMEDSVRKAIAIFRLTGIPLQEHIRGVFRSDFNGTKRDWMLSELACSLIVLVSDANAREVDLLKNDFPGL
ncbi:MAG: hypothetical protein R2757_15245 [Draconibacterium sp.]